MANQITGTILLIGQKEAIPYQDKVFYKRELVLDASRFDQFSGRKFENYPKFEFTGNNCDKLDQFPVGTLVTVSFTLSGRRKEENGQVSFFTNVTGYDIVLYSRNGQPQTVQQPVAAPVVAPQPAPVQNPPYTSPSAPTGMSAAQPFPPAVDEDGNPIGGNADDLPF